MYDLNKTPYDYKVEVTNRVKGLDLIERTPGELWMEFCNIIQEAVTKTIAKKKKKEMQGSKIVIWGGLINSWEKGKGNQRRKGKLYPTECRVPKSSRMK